MVKVGIAVLGRLFGRIKFVGQMQQVLGVCALPNLDDHFEWAEMEAIKVVLYCQRSENIE